jgi:hypothetical protein
MSAMEPLNLEAAGDDGFLLPEDRERFEAFQFPKQACYVMTSSIDGLSLLRRDLKSLADAADLKREIYGGKGLAPLEGVADLPSHAIFDRGRLVGLWEYDTATESIAWCACISKNRDMEKAVSRTEEYIRTQLGDARAFSLDSPKSRTPRVEALREGKGATCCCWMRPPLPYGRGSVSSGSVSSGRCCRYPVSPNRTARRSWPSHAATAANRNTTAAVPAIALA